jgi:glycosyltransferase involved in cell wall biosynthesis
MGPRDQRLKTSRTRNADEPMSISVVIPAYNHGAYIQDAIASVRNQSYPVEEIIVVDDGSSDNTADMVRSAGSDVRYFYQHNQGPSRARNLGAQNARGRWVAFLDADDWWDERKIEYQIAVLKHTPDAVLVYSSMEYILPDGSREFVEAFPLDRIWPTLRYRNCVTGSGSGVLVRRDVLLEAGGFNDELAASEDWDLWIRLAAKYPFASAPKSVSFVRRLSGSNGSDPQRLLSNTEAILESTLLLGLKGWRRHVWRRKIRAALYHRVAVFYPENSREQRFYEFRSLSQWPFLDIFPERWLLALRLTIGSASYEWLASRIRRTQTRRQAEGSA